MRMVIDRIYAYTVRRPALHQFLKPLGGPVYRILQRLTFWYWRRRTGWVFPSTMAPSSGLQMASGIYEAATRRLLQDLLHPGAICLDIGANIGYFTAVLAQASQPTGRVLAIEPEPNNYCCLLHNTQAFANVIPLALAATHQNGLVQLFTSSHASCHSVVPTQTYLDDGMRMVPSVTVDTLCDLIGLTRLDVIKMDVEGAELLVLQGMQQSLQQGRIRHLILEYAPELMRNAELDPMQIWHTLHPYFTLAVINETELGARPPDRLETLEAFGALTEQLLAQSAGAHVNLWGKQV